MALREDVTSAVRGRSLMPYLFWITTGRRHLSTEYDKLMRQQMLSRPATLTDQIPGKSLVTPDTAGDEWMDASVNTDGGSALVMVGP